MLTLGIAGLISCNQDSPTAGAIQLRIGVASGDGQQAAAGAELALPLQVRVVDAAGVAVRGVRVRFLTVGGSASRGRLRDSVAVTAGDGLAGDGLAGDGLAGDGLAGDGLAGVRAVVGDVGDTLVVEASVAFVAGSRVRFAAVATTGPAVATVLPSAVQAGDTITVAGAALGGTASAVRFGDVTASALPGATDAEVRAVVPACMTTGPVAVGVDIGGARSNTRDVAYTAKRLTLNLQPFEHATVPASELANCVELLGAGATYIITGQFASAPPGPPTEVSWELGVGSLTASRSRESVGPSIRATSHTRLAFEGHIRSVERAVASQARAERQTASLSNALAASLPALGSMRKFSVVASVDGSRFTSVSARLRYVGDHILLYTDTAVAGYDIAQLQALATLFDTHLWGAAVNAFGSEPDVDGNGRVIVLFTPAVNALTPAASCIQSGYVTGFFYPIDQLERAAHSNRGEIFYSIVPDPTGAYSCVHSEAEAIRIVQGTYLHEMQHLISFNEHVLARGGLAEDTWLNEGLSHIAEELGSRLFEMRYPAPLARGSAEQLFPDSAAPFIGPLLLNAYLYLNSPLQHSVTAYSGTGSIEERGATWLFLRWLADQKGDLLLRRLVQTPRTGVANVESATGERFAALFGDFSLALFADSLPGVPRQAVPQRLRYSNRAIRQLMAREAVVSGFAVPFPLATYLAAPGGTLRGSMLPGTMVHAIVSSDSGAAPLRLSFAAPELASFNQALGAQLGIMRLPP